MRCLDGITHTMAMKLGKLWEMVRDRDHTIARISHASKVMLNILQASLQQYMNCEIPDVQAAFGKGRGIRDQIANIC